MKCLSFIGTGTLRDTRYRYHDAVCQTPVVQKAISSFFPVEELILFTTRRAEETNYQQVLSSCPSGKKVTVPDGRSEEELWEIFTIVADEVKEGDTIIFDITHGFRSLPFIALLSAAYLQEVKGAKLAALVYGAFEAGDGIETPLFDLSGFLQIFDWMAGIRSFLNHSDAGNLKSLIQKISSTQFQASGGKTGPSHINSFASKLDGFTSAVRLSRPIEGIDYARSLIEALPGAEEEIGRYTPVLVPVLGKINSIKRFSSDEPDPFTGPSLGYLKCQLELIRFQIEQGLYQQAVTLAREWMVSVLIYAVGDGKVWLKKKPRSEAEFALSGSVKKLNNDRYDRSCYSDWFESLSNWEECAKCWNKITDLRNDIAHCGMNVKGQKASRLETRVKNLPEELENYLKYMV